MHILFEVNAQMTASYPHVSNKSVTVTEPNYTLCEE